ncbi:hypothetical protein HDU86_006496 [Geranomyces michiganensis]|nr:hypothetical protein HDU86_006496 [Geranomyces michiganensis]
MDFAYLDRLLAASRRLDKDLQELVYVLYGRTAHVWPMPSFSLPAFVKFSNSKTISLPPATPSPSARSNFLSRTEARISAVGRAAEDVENGALFYGTQGRATAAELVDAASDAALQLESSVQAARVFLERYGYEGYVPQVAPIIAPAAESEAMPYGGSNVDDDDDDDDDVGKPIPQNLLFPPQRSRDSLPDVAPYIPISPLKMVPNESLVSPRSALPSPLRSAVEVEAVGTPTRSYDTPSQEPASPTSAPPADSQQMPATPPRPPALIINTGGYTPAVVAPPAHSGQASPPDSPLASLEDFGLSALSLNILDAAAASTQLPRVEQIDQEEEEERRASIPSYTSTATTATGSQQAYYSPRMPVASSLETINTRRERSFSPTPAIPTTVPLRSTTTGSEATAAAPAATTTSPRDANSLFTGLLSPVTSRDEYARLLPDAARTMSLDYLNEMINEINESLTDARFMGKQDDCISVQELSAAACIEPARAEAVISVLTSLGKLQRVATCSSKRRDARYKVVA